MSKYQIKIIDVKHSITKILQNSKLKFWFLRNTFKLYSIEFNGKTLNSSTVKLKSLTTINYNFTIN